MAPLRTGAARIALMAEDRTGWNLGLKIAPVGLTYGRKHLFRGRGLAVYGEPFAVSDYGEAYARDPRATVRTLTDEIGRRMRALTLNFADVQDRDLVETAERLYAREKGWARSRQREGLARRFPRLQTFSRGLAWLQVYDPARYQSIRRRVAVYRRKARVLGAEEGDVPRRYRGAAALRYLLREGAPFLIGLPFAAVGAVLWWPAYKAPMWLVRIAQPHLEAVATYKLSAAVGITPLVLAFWLALSWLLGGWTLVAAMAVMLPVLGLIAIAWRDRWLRVKEDTLLFWRALGQTSRRDHLAELRASLVTEIDALAELFERASEPGSPPDSPAS
jgi:hypothetical protein